MRRYALRYLIILILALLLLPMRSYLQSPNKEKLTQALSGDNVTINPGMPLMASPFTPGNALYGIALLSPQDIWAVGGGFKIVNDTSAQVQQVVPTQGLILHYQNGGWLANTSLAEPLLSISMSSAKDGWAVGYAGQLDHFQGSTWQASQAPTQAVLSSVSMLSAQDGWAVGFDGTILHFQDQRWSRVPSPTPADLLSVKMVSAQDGWIVGSNGTILHYSQDQWHIFQSPTAQTLNSVSMLSAQEGWAVGDQETIIHYRDGVWSPVQSFPYTVTSPNEALLDVSMSSEQSGWIVGQQTLLTYSQEVWLGRTLIGSDPTLYAVVMRSPDDGWAVGSNDGIYHYQAGIWQSVYASY